MMVSGTAFIPGRIDFLVLKPANQRNQKIDEETKTHSLNRLLTLQLAPHLHRQAIKLELKLKR